MKRLCLPMAMVACVTGSPWLVGCDRTVSSSETTRVKRDGTVVRQSDTVREKADGTIVREKEKTVNP